MNWTALSLLAALASAAGCIVTALVARDGQLFALALMAGIGIAAGIAYAAFALRATEARIAKLSEELTVQSQRLMRLEGRDVPSVPEPVPSYAQDIEALGTATGALADTLEAQDARLRALEKRIAAATAEPSLPPHAEVLGRAEPRSTRDSASPDQVRGRLFEAPLRGAPQDEEVGGIERSPPAEAAPAPRLTTREDFARAASAILGRLAPEPLRVIEAPSDDAVVAELDAGRVELWLQPIVTLPQRRVRLYAALPHLRGREGEALGPDLVRPVLARRRKLDRLDAFALSQGLLVASHLAERGRETALCIRLSREALANPAFLEGAAARLAEDRAAASRLVFEIDHAEAQTLSAQETTGLDRLRTLGAGLAIGAIPDLDQDWAALGRRGFAHAMIAVDTILAPRPHATTAFLVAEAARARLSLVATGVEQEPQVPDLLDFDVPLARGPALAPARPVRAEVMAPKAEAEPAAEAPVERMSFRDYLRRAG